MYAIRQVKNSGEYSSMLPKVYQDSEIEEALIDILKIGKENPDYGYRLYEINVEPRIGVSYPNFILFPFPQNLFNPSEKGKEKESRIYESVLNTVKDSPRLKSLLKEMFSELPDSIRNGNIDIYSLIE